MFVYSQHQISVMFYNLENCFDCFDDSLNTGDDQYLPDGRLRWTFNRYKHKLNNLSKVILSGNKWEPPALIGVCEVENKTVLNHLIYWTGLKNLEYRYVHFQSPDKRGIDVALLYRKDMFRPLVSLPVNVDLGFGRSTRDILMVKGILSSTDTVVVFVNHWPSRYGGLEKSAPKRLIASKTLIEVVDSIREASPNMPMILMGDFNDSPEDFSIKNIEKKCFFNATSLLENNIIGTNKYRYKWEVIDQILLSNSYIEKIKNKNEKIQFKIVDFDFLLEPDITFLGVKPFRTYQGPKYKGGFSDHLPVMFIIKNTNE